MLNMKGALLAEVPICLCVWVRQEVSAQPPSIIAQRCTHYSSRCTGDMWATQVIRLGVERLRIASGKET